MQILIAEFIAEVLPFQDKSRCKNFVSSSVNEYNVQGIMCPAIVDVCTLASDLLICVDYIVTNVRAVCCFFCSCHVSMCFTCFYFSFYGKKFDLNSFDISSRLNVFCAFMLDVEICFQCFDSVGWSSGRMLAYSLNVCLYISDRLRVFGYYTRCAIITALY